MTPDPEPHQAPDKLVYSIDEAAEQLSIGRTLVYRLIRTGHLPSLKIGHRRLVARADLEAFVNRLRDGEAA
ncbi:MAG: helix-turn-helix domain-containing protein [Actinomycetota bacterium]